MAAIQRSPLEGIKVLDLSRVIAGPLASQILADCGADVIKVEAPDEGDPSRSYTTSDGKVPISPLFEQLNRNKRSIVLDLKSPEGKEAVWALIADSDILLHNFRPGVMERLGLGYGDVSESNPRLIYCSVSGFGDVGPLRDRAANDVIMQGYSGIMSFTGEPGGQPVRAGVSIADMTAGLYAALGVLVALQARTHTGRGDEVKTSLLEGQVALAASSLIEHRLTGFVPTPMGSATRVGLPNEAFPASDGPLLIAAVNERSWRRLCAAIGQENMATDPRFSTLERRRRHRGELFAELAAWTRKRTRAECVEILGAAGIPCGPVNTIAEVSEDAQFNALGMWVPVQRPDADLCVIRQPLRFSSWQPQMRRPAPEKGAHTEEVLRELRADPALLEAQTPVEGGCTRRALAAKDCSPDPSTS